jgi:hypothetical protein
MRCRLPALRHTSTRAVPPHVAMNLSQSTDRSGMNAEYTLRKAEMPDDCFWHDPDVVATTKSCL